MRNRRGCYEEDEHSIVDQFFYCFKGVSSILAAVVLFICLFYGILYLALKN